MDSARPSHWSHPHRVPDRDIRNQPDGSSVVVEEVFARPGLGKLMVGATKQRDYTALQSIMVVYALIIVIINLLTGIVYTFVDPRVRLHA
ncbi:MAG: hypothetical protein C4346_00970 [Chloroflexota bacterium]